MRDSFFPPVILVWLILPFSFVPLHAATPDGNPAVATANPAQPASTTAKVITPEGKSTGTALEPYTRIVETQPRHFELQVAMRRFESPGKPSVWLTGNIHLGTPDYYLALQKFLDQQPVVLYENANNSVPMSPGPAATNAERKAWTEKALHLVGQLVEGYQSWFMAYPDSIDTVDFALDPASGLNVSLHRAMVDGWGHPVTYRKTETGYELHSAGAGGPPDPALTVVHTGEGFWSDMGNDRFVRAETEGLLGQMEGIFYDHPNFVFCDMLVDDYKRRIAEVRNKNSSHAKDSANAAFNVFFKKYSNNRMAVRYLMLEYSGWPHIAQDLNPTDAEDRLNLLERNDVVWAEMLRRFSSSQPICVLYGFAHMYDLQSRMASHEGYALAETRWMVAFDVDLSASGISDRDIAKIQDDGREGRYGWY